MYITHCEDVALLHVAILIDFHGDVHHYCHTMLGCYFLLTRLQVQYSALSAAPSVASVSGKKTTEEC